MSVANLIISGGTLHNTCVSYNETDLIGQMLTHSGGAFLSHPNRFGGCVLCFVFLVLLDPVVPVPSQP